MRGRALRGRRAVAANRDGLRGRARAREQRQRGVQRLIRCLPVRDRAQVGPDPLQHRQ